jgi:hypothetical protein
VIPGVLVFPSLKIIDIPLIPTGAQRSGEPALSEVEWGSAVCPG